MRITPFGVALENIRVAQDSATSVSASPQQPQAIVARPGRKTVEVNDERSGTCHYGVRRDHVAAKGAQCRAFQKRYPQVCGVGSLTYKSVVAAGHVLLKLVSYDGATAQSADAP